MNQRRQEDGGDAPMTSAAFHGGFTNLGSSQSQSQQQHQQTAAAAATTMTMMEPATTAPAASMTAPPEVLTLTLQPRPSVRWEEETVDNEGLGRKSSKRCCIFHKQRDFGESSTDSSDNDGDDNNDSDDSSSSGGPRQQGAPPRRPIARPKKQPNKDAQRYHA